MRIVHCADVHIGKDFGLIKTESHRRKSEILQGFISFIDYCIETDTDVLLIAGDLFDNDNVSHSMISQVKEEMKKAKDMDIYIVAGNHDPYITAGMYRGNWPENVHIFKDKPEVITRRDKGYRVWGCSFAGSYVNEGILSNADMSFLKMDDELINLGVLHGQLVGGFGESVYNPITDEDIKKSNLDYLALGHVHKSNGILRQGKTFYSYCGTMEGQGFDEDGIKGFYEGEITKEEFKLSRCNLRFASLSYRRYYHVNADITGAADINKMISIIKDRIENVDDELTERNLYKVNLTGTLDEDVTFSVRDIENRLGRLYYFVSVVNNTKIKADYARLSVQNSLKGMFVRKMLSKIENNSKKENDYDEPDDLYMKALEYGLRAFSNEVIIDEDNKDIY